MVKYIKPKLILAVLLLLAFIALPAHARMKNEPKGYGGFKWNTSAKNIFGKYKKNLIMTGDSGHFEIFKNKKEADAFDGMKKVKVENVLYFFNKSDGFAAVKMSFDLPKADFKKLMKRASSKWGKPDEFDDIEKSDGWIRSGGGKWRGKKTFVKIRGSLYGSKDESVSGKIIIGLKEYDGYI